MSIPFQMRQILLFADVLFFCSSVGNIPGMSNISHWFCSCAELGEPLRLGFPTSVTKHL